MRIELRSGMAGWWWWALVAKNQQILATSETYAGRSNARRAARRVAAALKLPFTGRTTATEGKSRK